VRYILKNTDNRGHRVGIRFMLDTYIGDNDGVSFLIPGDSHLCDTKKAFETSAKVPDFIQALENNDLQHPGTVAYLQFRFGNSVQSPDRVLLGGWPDSAWRDAGIKGARAHFTGWEVPFISIKERVGGKVTNDSAVTMYWNEQQLEPDKTRTVGFAYSLGNVDASESGGHILLTVGGRLVPLGEFTLTALVHDPKADEKLTLDLPKGFSIAKDDKEQKVPSVPAKASRPDSPVTWRIKAGAEGKYELTVRSSVGKTQKLLVHIRTVRGVFD